MPKQSLQLILPTDPKRSKADQIFLQDVQRVVSAYAQYGSSSGRPTTDLYIGRTFFDDELNTTVVWNGVDWVTAGDTTQFTANSFVYGSSTGGIKSSGAAENGQLLIGSTGNEPVLGNITVSGGLSIENGPGTIKLTNTGVASVSGVLNRIDVAPNTGNVNVNISPSYVGQTSITTLGTITIGTWNGNTIEVPYGGTGLTTLPLNNVLLGNATSAPTFVAPSTSGNLLTSNGTTWLSSPPHTITLTGAVLGSGTTTIATTMALPEAATVANSAAINTTETYITSAYQIPANNLAAGDVFKITIQGTCTSTVANLSTFNVRFGTAGTTADTIILATTCTSAVSGTNTPFMFEAWVTVRTIGAPGTAIASSRISNTGVLGISDTPNVIAGNGTTANITTTGALFLGVSYVTAAVTTTSTFYTAVVEKVR